MNKHIFAILVTVLFCGCAEHQIKKQYNDVTLRTCKPALMGCADRLVIDGKDMLVDTVNKDIELKYNNFKDQLKKKKKFETKLNSVEGFSVIEKGHFPNPMADFEVFKLYDLRP